jgi:hypothetical protein
MSANHSLVFSNGGEKPVARVVSRLLRLYEKKRGDRRTGSSKLGSVGEASFFGVFLLLGMAAFTVMLVTIVWPELRANRHFLETNCKVVATAISENRNDDSITYRPDVTIEFDVAGKRHRTTTYDAARLHTSNRHKAQAAIDEFQVGKEYDCWYDPMNPDRAVLVRGYSGWMYLLLLVPVSFIVIGGGGLVYTLWHWGASAERRSSLAQRASKIDLLNEPVSERNDYPQVPSDTDWKSSPGTKLAYRLPIGSAPGWQLFAVFFACLFWNGITSVFVVIAVRSHLRGEPEWFLTVFIVPFVLIGLVLVYALVRQLLITTGVGPTRIEISQHPLHPCEPCELYLSQAGRLTMNSFEVLLVCDEHATYRQGTDTRTEQRRVLEQSVYRRDGFEIDQTVPFEHQWSVTIPVGAMHSFKSTHNEVRWKLLVKGDVAGWPNFEREYPVIVYPAHHREAEV